MCGRPLTRGQPSYDIHIEVISTFDPNDFDSLESDGADDLEALLDALTGVGEEELNDQVYREFMFRICRSCQSQYIRAPLPRSLYRRRGQPGPDGPMKSGESRKPEHAGPDFSTPHEESDSPPAGRGRKKGKVIPFPGLTRSEGFDEDE